MYKYEGTRLLTKFQAEWELNQVSSEGWEGWEGGWGDGW